MWSVRVSTLVIALVYASAGCAHRNESPTVAMVRANCEARGVGTRDEIQKTCDEAAAQAAAGEPQDAVERDQRQLREDERRLREQYRQNEERAAQEMRRIENERREADEPATKPANEQWPVEEQPPAETRAEGSQAATDSGPQVEVAAVARPPPAVEDMGGGWYVVREDVPRACVTLGSIDAVNDMMTRQRRVERESGVVDLSAKRKLGGMLVALRGQLAAQQEAFKRDTGRAFDRKRDCAELQAALADTQAIETTAEDPQARVRARNIACNAFEWIEIYDGQMKRQRAIERESGVEDLAAKRKIGEVLAGAKTARAKALVDFKRLWKRSFKRATDCATPP